MSHADDSPGDLSLSATIAGQFSYHVRMAAVFAVAGETQESASESVLAWTILVTCWPGAHPAALATARELVGQDQVSVSDRDRDAAQSRAHALALELEAHFVSVGLHKEAELYSSVADHLGNTIQTLVNSN